MRGFLSGSRSSPAGSIFEELLLEHLDGLYTFALRLTGERAAAEDLVQEAALKAFTAFQSLRERASFRSWVYTILRHTFLDRRSEGERLLWGSLEECGEGALADAGETLLLEKVLMEEIRQAIDRLPLSFRATLWLSDVEGFSQREIARILDCSMGTVASRLHRARRLLRLELGRGGAAGQVVGGCS